MGCCPYFIYFTKVCRHIFLYHIMWPWGCIRFLVFLNCSANNMFEITMIHFAVKLPSGTDGPRDNEANTGDVCAETGAPVLGENNNNWVQMGIAWGWGCLIIGSFPLLDMHTWTYKNSEHKETFILSQVARQSAEPRLPTRQRAHCCQAHAPRPTEWWSPGHGPQEKDCRIWGLGIEGSKLMLWHVC